MTIDRYREPYELLRRQLANPAPGWFTFGTHVDSKAKLEFWGRDEAGMPLWERPETSAPETLEGPPGSSGLEYAYGEVLDGELYVYFNKDGGEPFATYAAAYEARIEDSDVVVARRPAGDWEFVTATNRGES